MGATGAMGATHTIDYRNGLREPMKGLGIEQVDAILLAQEPDAYWSDVCELVAPLGGIVTIVDARGPLDVNPLKPKSARFAWEFMFTRPLFGRRMQQQGDRLAELATLVDKGVIQTTVSEGLGPINADGLYSWATVSDEGLKSLYVLARDVAVFQAEYEDEVLDQFAGLHKLGSQVSDDADEEAAEAVGHVKPSTLAGKCSTIQVPECHRWRTTSRRREMLLSRCKD